jgi:hypothetical protein
MASQRPFAYVVFNGEGLSADPRPPGGASGPTRAGLDGNPVRGAYAHVCALTDRDAALPYDMAEVQQTRRDVLACWISMLGDALVCVTTLAFAEP